MIIWVYVLLMQHNATASDKEGVRCSGKDGVTEGRRKHTNIVNTRKVM